jgi:quinol-cytochrome oxidoreductase complex cytochrome b subunit
MVAAFIFLFHFLAFCYVFFNFKKTALSEGFLAVALMGIVFAVGWTIATMLTNVIFMPEWFIRWYYQPLNSLFWRTVRKEINRDTISLLILTGGEMLFYFFYFMLGTKKGPSHDEPSQTPKL